MTKKNVLISIALLAIVSFFTSCVESEDAPSITVITPTADSIDVFVGDSVVFDIALSADNGLSSFKAMSTASGVELSNYDLTFNGSSTEDIAVVAKVTEDAQVGNVTLNFVVNGSEKTASTSKVLVITKKETPLADAETFEWVRQGGNDATGLEQFGLTWTDNLANDEGGVSAVIKKGADKFVELDATVWADISNVEALAEAIDAAEDMDSWRKISVDKSDTYDYTIGTKVENTYYLIHITNTTVSVEDIGTIVTISGEYKK